MPADGDSSNRGSGAERAGATSASAAQRAIPNVLTIARVVLAIACFVCLGLADARVTRGEVNPSFQRSAWMIGALVLFVLAAATDALDGYLARKWHVISRFGRVMDPFADKLLVLGAFIMLAHPRFWAGMHVPVTTPLGVLELAGVQGWMVVAILGRELLVTSLRGVYERDGVDFSATLSGKVKMVLQSIAAPLAMLILATQPNPVPRGIAAGLAAVIWLTVVVTLVSGLPYGLRALRTERGGVR